MSEKRISELVNETCALREQVAELQKQNDALRKESVQQCFNDKLDKYKFAIIPTDEVGYYSQDEYGSEWGNWHIKSASVQFANKVLIVEG